jgi:hypothetical protein
MIIILGWRRSMDMFQIILQIMAKKGLAFDALLKGG